MKTYIDNSTEEKVEAIQWAGESSQFYDWEQKLGKLPFSYLEFPRMRIQNTPSKLDFIFFANPGDWIVKTKANFFQAYRPSVFNLRFKEKTFFTL